MLFNMPLGCTHIRFAEDFKDVFDPVDELKYFSGAMYPDSRYHTKIAREKTHDLKITLSRADIDDDFRKGWTSHIVCDEAFTACGAECANLLNGSSEEFGEVWIRSTVVKMILDELDFKAFDMHSFVRYFIRTESPWNEDTDSLDMHYASWAELYEGVSEINPDTFLKHARPFLPEHVCDRLKELAEENKESGAIRRCAEHMHECMYAYFRKRFLLKYN